MSVGQLLEMPGIKSIFIHESKLTSRTSRTSKEGLPISFCSDAFFFIRKIATYTCLGRCSIQRANLFENYAFPPDTTLELHCEMKRCSISTVACHRPELNSIPDVNYSKPAALRVKRHFDCAVVPFAESRCRYTSLRDFRLNVAKHFL